MDELGKEFDREILWAPWRMAYINENGENKKTAEEKKPTEVLPGGDPDCFVCQAVADLPPTNCERLTIGETETTTAILNRFPYNNGHLLIAPKRHVARLDLLTPEEWRDITAELTYWTNKIEKKMNAEGFNVGLNLGRVAGAGLPGHLHWHIVPRWSGDANFITTVGSTKSIPQALEACWMLLKRD